MDANRIPKPNPDIIWREVDDGVVLVSPTAGKVRVLNGVGTTIWKLMDGQRTVGTIIDHLVDQYDVPANQATQDLQIFIKDLADKGLVSEIA